MDESKILVIPGLSCYDIAFPIDIASKGGDYRPLFRDCWRFVYQGRGEDGRMGQSIVIQHNIRDLSVEQYNCRIKVSYAGKALVNEIFADLDRQIPCIILLDEYECPWSLVYQKEHVRHSLILTKREGDTVFYLDPLNLFQPNGQMKAEELNAAQENGGIIVCEAIDFTNGRHNCRLQTASAAIRDLRVAIENIKENQMLEHLEKLVGDFKERFLFETEYKDYRTNILYAYFHLYLKKAIESRLLFLSYLEYMQETFLFDLQQIINEFRVLHSKWSLLIAQLSKCVYIGFTKDQKERIDALFDLVLEKERKLFAALQNEVANINFLNKDQTGVQSDAGETDSPAFYIDLKACRNAVAFTLEQNIVYSFGSFGDSGEGCYYYNRPFQDACELEEADRYHFPRIEQGKKDHMECTGQQVPVYRKGIRKILLLCCLSCGTEAEIERFQVKTSNGEEISFYLSIDPWTAQPQHVTTRIAAQFPAIYLEDGKCDEYCFAKGKIFEQVIDLKGAVDVESLIFPDNPIIKIFAVTVL